MLQKKIQKLEEQSDHLVQGFDKLQGDIKVFRADMQVAIQDAGEGNDVEVMEISARINDLQEKLHKWQVTVSHTACFTTEGCLA